MLSIALFHTVDGLGRFDPSSLPDQTLMELLVENFTPRAKEKYQTSGGSYYDISEWSSV